MKCNHLIKTEWKEHPAGRGLYGVEYCAIRFCAKCDAKQTLLVHNKWMKSEESEWEEN